MIKVVSIFLAFQVLLSSLSFNIGMHFCGDQLQSLALFEKAQPCEHAKPNQPESSSCPFHKTAANDEKKGCCGDKSIKIEGQEHESIISTVSFDFTPQIHFLAAYIYTPVENPFYEGLHSPQYHHYKPPLIRQNIPILIQTFLI